MIGKSGILTLVRISRISSPFFLLKSLLNNIYCCSPVTECFFPRYSNFIPMCILTLELTQLLKYFQNVSCKISKEKGGQVLISVLPNWGCLHILEEKHIITRILEEKHIITEIHRSVFRFTAYHDVSLRQNHQYFQHFHTTKEAAVSDYM